MSSSSAPDRSASSATAVELPAPPGWRKKFMPKKSATPGPRMGTVVFISPSGEEIKNKAQLDRYLKAHPGGHSPSDFDWSTGEIPRRSARLGQKVKASEMPEDEPPAKRARKSRPAKAEVVHAKHDSDIEMEDVGASDKEEPSTEVPSMKEEALPQITEDETVDRIVEPMPTGDAKSEDLDKDVPAGDEANKNSVVAETKVEEEKDPKTNVVAETKVEEDKEDPETNVVAETKLEEENGPETNVVAETKVEEERDPETNVAAKTKVEEKGPETNVVAETTVEEAKSPGTNVAAETKVEENGPETKVASETKDKLEKYVVENAKEHAPLILNNGHGEIKDVSAEEIVKEDDNSTEEHCEVPKHIVGETDKEPSSVSVAPAGASSKTEQSPGEISTAKADLHEKPQESMPKDVPSAP